MEDPVSIHRAYSAQEQAARIQAEHADTAAAATSRVADGLDIARIVFDNLSAHRVGPMTDAEQLVADLQAAGYMEPDEDQGDMDHLIALAKEAISGKAASERLIATSLAARRDALHPSSADDSAA